MFAVEAFLPLSHSYLYWNVHHPVTSVEVRRSISLIGTLGSLKEVAVQGVRGLRVLSGRGAFYSLQRPNDPHIFRGVFGIVKY